MIDLNTEYGFETARYLESALCLAASDGNTNLVSALILIGVDVDSCGLLTDCPLMCAVKNDHVFAASLLLDSGALVNNRFAVDDFSFSRSMLGIAQARGNPEMIALIENVYKNV